MKSSEYYWVYGDRKYSEVVRGRWTPETASTATYPRLTTQNNTHNFRNSDFWMYKNDCFNLSKLQLTYDLPSSLFQARWYAACRSMHTPATCSPLPRNASSWS